MDKKNARRYDDCIIYSLISAKKVDSFHLAPSGILMFCNDEMQLPPDPGGRDLDAEHHCLALLSACWASFSLLKRPALRLTGSHDRHRQRGMEEAGQSLAGMLNGRGKGWSTELAGRP